MKRGEGRIFKTGARVGNSGVDRGQGRKFDPPWRKEISMMRASIAEMGGKSPGGCS